MMEGSQSVLNPAILEIDNTEETIPDVEEPNYGFSKENEDSEQQESGIVNQVEEEEPVKTLSSNEEGAPSLIPSTKASAKENLASSRKQSQRSSHLPQSSHRQSVGRQSLPTTMPHQLQPSSDASAKGSVVWLSQRTGKEMKSKFNQTSFIWERKPLAEILHPSSKIPKTSKGIEKTVASAREYKDIEKAEADTRETKDTEKAEADDREAKDTEKAEEDDMETKDTEKAEAGDREAKDTEKAEAGDREAKDTEKAEADDMETKDTEKAEADDMETKDTEKAEVDDRESKDMEKDEADEREIVTPVQDTEAEQNAVQESAHSMQPLEESDNQGGSPSPVQPEEQASRHGSKHTVVSQHIQEQTPSPAQPPNDAMMEGDIKMISKRTGKEMKCSFNQTSLIWERKPLAEILGLPSTKTPSPEKCTASPEAGEIKRASVEEVSTAQAEVQQLQRDNQQLEALKSTEGGGQEAPEEAPETLEKVPDAFEEALDDPEVASREALLAPEKVLEAPDKTLDVPKVASNETLLAPEKVPEAPDETLEVPEESSKDALLAPEEASEAPEEAPEAPGEAPES